ncbi:MAG: sodium:calcium antiporter [Dehalococcoidia bacterium]
MLSAATGTWPLWLALLAVLPAAGAIALLGTRLAKVTDRLADRTGIGEAVAGAVILGATTSLAGLIVSIVAASSGEPSLAVSNSLGGIAVQTSFIAWIDLVHRGVNVEHAAASLTNIFTAFLLALLLGLVVIGFATPEVAILGVHPVSFVIAGAYLYGIVLSQRVTDRPMWRAVETEATASSEPSAGNERARLTPMLLRFAILAAAVAAAGFVISRAGLSLMAETGLGGTVVGTLVTSVSTSIPELVTAFAAVKAGAMTLAVGGIIGGNTFDVLFISAADGFYREGAVYGALADVDVFTLGWSVLLTAILGAGLVSREQRGIGYEGVAILVVYVAGVIGVTLLG